MLVCDSMPQDHETTSISSGCDGSRDSPLMGPCLAPSALRNMSQRGMVIRQAICVIATRSPEGGAPDSTIGDTRVRLGLHVLGDVPGRFDGCPAGAVLLLRRVLRLELG